MWELRSRPGLSYSWVLKLPTPPSFLHRRTSLSTFCIIIRRYDHRISYLYAQSVHIHHQVPSFVGLHICTPIDTRDKLIIIESGLFFSLCLIHYLLSVRLTGTVASRCKYGLSVFTIIIIMNVKYEVFGFLSSSVWRTEVFYFSRGLKFSVDQPQSSGCSNNDWNRIQIWAKFY